MWLNFLCMSAELKGETINIVREIVQFLISELFEVEKNILKENTRFFSSVMNENSAHKHNVQILHLNCTLIRLGRNIYISATVTASCCCHCF